MRVFMEDLLKFVPQIRVKMGKKTRISRVAAALLLLASVGCVQVWAQSWEQIKADKNYVWGEGRGTTVAEADRRALADLVGQICTQVSSDFEMLHEERQAGEEVLDSKTYVKDRLNTYSQATLTNTARFILKNEPDAVVGRAIKTTEIARIFESRVAKAKDMVQTGLRAESAGKADDALRNYYWAFALVRSLQRPNEVEMTDEQGLPHRLMVWIPELMNQVFDNLRVVVTGREGDDVDLAISYKGRPVSSVDYTYFDGRDWSAINSAKDGRGILELAPGNQSGYYKLKIEYEYQSEAHIDKEVEEVLRVVASRAMKKSYLQVDAKQVRDSQAFVSQQSFSTTAHSVKSALAPVAKPGAYAQAMDDVMRAVRMKNIELASCHFTVQGLDIFRRLVFAYGTARIVGTPQPTFYPSEDGGVVARGVQMSFAFKSGVRKSFVEDMVFTFNAKGKIDNVAFGLGKIAEDDILHKGVWSDTARKVLMAFMENYKTAYALKRLDYISTIFDDDAVIITAYEAKRSTAPVGERGVTFANDKVIRYNRYSKDQYLKNLARCFQSNEYINIRFEDNDVKRLGRGGELYAIQISQDYYSSTYGDKGYLFLILDVNDPAHPLIKVRTWQPEKDPDFGIYGPGDFK